MLFLFVTIYCSIHTDKPLVNKFAPIFAETQNVLDSPSDSFNFESAEKFVSLSTQLLKASTIKAKEEEEELIAIDLQCEIILTALANSSSKKYSAITFWFKKFKLRNKISDVTSTLKRNQNPIGTHEQTETLKTLGSEAWKYLHVSTAAITDLTSYFSILDNSVRF
jgi:hypothetical protein